MRTGFEEFAQLGCHLELRDGFEFLESRSRSEGIRETPYRAWPGSPRISDRTIQVMYAADKVLGGFQSALDKRLVYHHLGGDISQFTSLLSFNLLSHRFEVALHSVNAHRDAVDERERLRVFRKHGSEHASDNVSRFEPHEYYFLGRAWLHMLQFLGCPESSNCLRPRFWRAVFRAYRLLRLM